MPKSRSNDMKRLDTEMDKGINAKAVPYAVEAAKAARAKKVSRKYAPVPVTPENNRKIKNAKKYGPKS